MKRRSSTRSSSFWGPWIAVGMAAAMPARASAEPARAEAPAASPGLAFTRFVLPNGMPVILHEDHRVPLVVVDVSYDVGSRSEAPGRTGFAHLFEHLMFMGTRRAPEKMFDAWMESAGGWNNAWTSEDRTNYYDVGPSSALPLLLWLEADRMRDVGALMTQQKLDAQRAVVQNERRQSYENRPYGLADLRIQEMLYPQGHPYHHPVIGSHRDLQAAEVVDVRAFFTRFYDPANACLVVAGDFEPRATRTLIERYFASIPSRGKPSSGGSAPGPVVLERDVRAQMTDDVELTRLTLAWHSPAHLAEGDAAMDLLAIVLGQGPASRLHERLVVQDKLAQSVSAAQSSRALGSSFEIEVALKKGADPARIERVVEEEIRALNEGKRVLQQAELERAKALVDKSFFDRLESVRERASLLAMYESQAQDAGFLPKDRARYAKLDVSGLRAAAASTLGRKKVVLVVEPGARSSEAAPTALVERRATAGAQVEVSR